MIRDLNKIDEDKGLDIDNDWCEEPTRAKEKIKGQFKKRLGQEVTVRLDNIEF